VTRVRLALALAAALAVAGVTGCATRTTPDLRPAANSAAPSGGIAALSVDLDRLFDEDAALAGALVAVRIESLGDSRVIYSRNAASHVVPASALKIITAAVAADRLGWAHRFETRLEAAGAIVDGTLQGDLIVVGGGDPTIAARDLLTAPVFEEWVHALRHAGIQRVRGRIIGDDSAFDDEPLGAGWAWDYLTAAYAAPSGALSFNDNLVAIRVSPGGLQGHRRSSRSGLEATT
jgi:serine-type D-Ala-D-Ala carboxypeptidase/endopeptidase (penicillin-binding protein 4)